MIKSSNYLIKKTGILICILSISFFVSAQKRGQDESSHMGYMQGFYYDNSQTCIDGLIRFEFDQDNFIFFKSAYGARGQKVKAKEIKGFVILGDSFAVIKRFEIDSIFSKAKPLTYKEGFAQVLEIGEINLFKHQAVINFSIVNTFLFSRASDANNRLFTIHKRDANLFAAEVSEYLKDDHELSKAIRNKELQFSQLRQIVRRYNKNYTNRN